MRQNSEINNRSLSSALKQINNVLSFESASNPESDTAKCRLGRLPSPLRNKEIVLFNHNADLAVSILDAEAPNWSHRVKQIRQVGEVVAITSAICIDGVSREGIGVAFAKDVDPILVAESQSVFRAALKFEFVREHLSRTNQAGSPKQCDSTNPRSENGFFPVDPIGKSLFDMVTARQLGFIRKISRSIGISPDAESMKQMSCSTDELSKNAASCLIRHLQGFGNIPRRVRLRGGQRIERVG